MPYIQKRRIATHIRTVDKDGIKEHNAKWNRYYQNKGWKRLRDWFMSTHLICEDCMFEGRSVPAANCHHRVPFSWFVDDKDRMTALLDEDNLVALCEDCHHKRHKELKRPYNFEKTDYYKKIHCAV